MPQIKTSGEFKAKLNVVDQGKGQPVVLIHGWPLSHRMWESQITALTDAGYRAVAYDRRGFGESSKPAGGYDYDTFAADLRAIIEELDLRDVVLAGFSMGGGEVARYIGRYGTKRIAKAMLLGAVTPGLARGPNNIHGADASVFEGMMAGLKQDRIGFLAGFFPSFYNLEHGQGEELMHFSKWIAWAASPLATVECVRAFGTTDFTQDMKAFDVPTLIVHGDQDRIVNIDVSGRRAAGLVGNSRFEVLHGAPHGFAATHAGDLNRLMLEFLRG